MKHIAMDSNNREKGLLKAGFSEPEVLLINPPVYDFALYDLFHQPYGLMKIAAWFESGGYRISIIDALDIKDPLSAERLGYPRRKGDGTGKFFRQSHNFPETPFCRPERAYSRYGIVPETLRHRVSISNPDLVLISSGMTYWYPGVVEVCSLVKDLFPGVPVIVGGIYASLLPEHCEASTGAIAAPGEAGISVPPLLTRLGLPVPEGSPEDFIPRPDIAVQRGAGVLRLNRGCPFACRYCASRAITPRFKPGSADRTYAEFTHLYSRGLRCFAFYDDALLYEKEKTLFRFLEKIIRENIRADFYMPNACHVEYMDDETAGLLYRAGFKEARLGFESVSKEFQNEQGVKYSETGLLRAVKALKAAGFKGDKIMLYILAGLPEQEARETEESVRFALSLGVKPVIAEFSPVPGSSLWDKAVEKSCLPLKEEPLFHNNSLFAMEWEGFTKADMERLKRLSRGQ